jgi:3-methyladenine DNA glycosylase AlkD
MNADEVLASLEGLASGDVRDGMRRFGIPVDNAHGITVPQLKALARRLGKDHALALRLWDTGVFEARVVAMLVAEPEKVTRAQMDRWARAFDSWAVCDGCCCHLFRKTPFARAKALEWSGKKAPYVKRAGFALMAYLAVHDKQAADDAFDDFLAAVEREADDPHPHVQKGINWALRQIGKRNPELHARALRTAEAIRSRQTPGARWIAADALRELRSDAGRARLDRLREKKKAQ